MSSQGYLLIRIDLQAAMWSLFMGRIVIMHFGFHLIDGYDFLHINTREMLKLLS